MSNAAAKVFTRHNFTNYAESRYGSLLVTNMYGIVGGRDEEDDESYRYRIRLKIQASNGVNEAALRFEILRVPGIQDVYFSRSAGTFTCYVYAITPTASAALLDLVQEALNERVAFPLTGAAASLDLVGVSSADRIPLKSQEPDNATGPLDVRAAPSHAPRRRNRGRVRAARAELSAASGSVRWMEIWPGPALLLSCRRFPKQRCARTSGQAGREVRQDSLLNSVRNTDMEC